MFDTPDPRTVAQEIERSPPLLPGSEECFRGYAIMGVGYASGHVLALRRFPQTSIGPGYTSIWHHAPDRGWTIYTDVDQALSCPRYFSRAAASTVTTDIAITWTGPHTLVASMERPSLEWMLQLSSTRMTRILNATSPLCPERVRRNGLVLSMIARASCVALTAGTITLRGRVPNGQRFTAVPRLIWSVGHGAAILARRDLGRVRPLVHQMLLADFRIPHRGVFAVADAYFERFDPAHHAATTPPFYGVTATAAPASHGDLAGAIRPRE